MKAKYFFPEDGKKKMKEGTFIGWLHMALVMSPKEEEAVKGFAGDMDRAIMASGVKRVERVSRRRYCGRLAHLFYGGLTSLDTLRLYLERHGMKCRVENLMAPRFEELLHTHGSIVPDKICIFKNLDKEFRYQNFGKLFVAFRSENAKAVATFEEECTYFSEEARDFWKSWDKHTCIFRTYRHRMDRIRDWMAGKGFNLDFEVLSLPTLEGKLCFYAAMWE